MTFLGVVIEMWDGMQDTALSVALSTAESLAVFLLAMTRI